MEDVTGSRFKTGNFSTLPYRDFNEFAFRLAEDLTYFQDFHVDTYYNINDLRHLSEEDKVRILVSYWNENLKAVHFFHDMCVFEKGCKDISGERSLPKKEELLPSPARAHFEHTLHQLQKFVWTPKDVAPHESDLKALLLELLRQSNEDSLQRQTSLSYQIDRLRNQLDRAKSQLSRSNTQLEQRLHTSEQNAHKYEREMKARQDELENARSKIQAGENLIAEQKSALSKADNDIAEYKSALSKAADDITEYKSALSKADNDIAEYKSALSKADNDIAEYKSALSKAADDITEYKSALSKADNDIAEYKSALHKANNDIEESQIALNNALRKQRNTQQDLSLMKKKFRDTERKLNRHAKRLEKSGKQLEETRNEVSDLHTKAKQQAEKFEGQIEEQNLVNQRLSTELGALTQSLSWRATAPLRAISIRFPWARRQLVRLVKLVWWTLTFRLHKRLPQAMRNRRSWRLLYGPEGVDQEWYLARYPNVEYSGMDPVQHYARYGAKELFDPNPNFSTQEYLAMVPGLADSETNPLVHYLSGGRQQGIAAKPAAALLEEAKPVESDAPQENTDKKEHKKPAILEAKPQSEKPKSEKAMPAKQKARTPAKKPQRAKKSGPNKGPLAWAKGLGLIHGKSGSPEVGLGAIGTTKIFIAGHEATRTGAPLIILKLCEHLAALPGVELIICLSQGGPLVEDFAKTGTVIVNEGNVLFNGKGPSALKVLQRTLAPLPKIAICNTANVNQFAEVFQKLGASVITLVHENLLQYTPESLEKLDSVSDQVVFPAQAMLQVGLEARPELASKALVRSQGLLNPEFGSGDRDLARQRLREEIGVSPDTPIVLGCGTLDARKAIDLFMQLVRIMRDQVGSGVHYVWLGDDGIIPKWLRNDMRVLDLASHLHFLPNRPDPEYVFLGADVYALTSRFDPFPCVIHEAMACNLPIVVFDGAGGAPEAIAENCGYAVPYIDVHAMAEKIFELLNNEQERIAVGKRAEARVRDTYKFEAYGNQIIELCQELGANLPDTTKSPTDSKPKVFFSQRDWWISGVNTMTEEVLHHLVEEGFDAQLLFIEINPDDVGSIPDLPHTFLELGDYDLKTQWQMIEDFLTAQAPCILFPNYDYATSAISARLPSNVGIISTIQSDDVEHYDHALRLGRYWNHMIASSGHVERRLGELNPLFTDISSYVPNGVGDFLMEPKELKRPEDPIRLVYTGRLFERQKRALDLAQIALQLAEKNIDFVMTIIGAGEAEKPLRTQLSELVDTGQVVITGRIHRSEVPTYLSEADIFLLTSDFEGLPLSVLEGMAYRCAPIVTDIKSGIPDLVSDGENGFIVPIGDIDTFVSRICQLKDDPKLLQQFSQAAFERVHDGGFHRKDVGGGYAQIIKKVWDDITSGNYERPEPLIYNSPVEGISVPPGLIKTFE